MASLKGKAQAPRQRAGDGENSHIQQQAWANRFSDGRLHRQASPGEDQTRVHPSWQGSVEASGARHFRSLHTMPVRAPAFIAANRRATAARGRHSEERRGIIVGQTLDLKPPWIDCCEAFGSAETGEGRAEPGSARFGGG